MTELMIKSLKITWSYVMGIGLGILSFSALFFLYAKYKTGKDFKPLLQMYIEIVTKSLLYTSFVLGLVFVLVHYVPVSYIIIFLLTVSSLAILLKYLFIRSHKKVMIFDIGVILANMYCSYVLLMQDRFDVNHYLLLGFVILCFFLYQQIKKIT